MTRPRSLRAALAPGQWAALAFASALLLGCPDAAFFGEGEVPAQSSAAAPDSSSGAQVKSESQGGPPAMERAPEGTQAFPMPSPLPPEALPRSASAEAPGPRSGAGVDFWIGGSGKSEGRFHYPRACVCDAQGNLYVADKSGRIQKFDAKGRLLRVVRTPGIAQGKPTGMGFDEAGNLLVADTHYCRVLVYTPELKLKRWFGAPGAKPGRFMMITSVQARPQGGLLTTDFGLDVARVQLWSGFGKLASSFGVVGEGKGALRRPMNSVLDSKRGRIYVADAVNHRVAVFSLEGKWLGQLGKRGKAPGELEYPYDLKLDEQGRLWIAEFGNHRLSVLDPLSGRCLGIWGKPGRQVGGLNRPWAVALGPGERVWVLDSLRDRCYALTRGAVLFK